MLSFLTPRAFARAPFRVAVSLATGVAVVGAGGFMALPKAPEPSPAPAPAPAPATPPPPVATPLAVSPRSLIATAVKAKPTDINCLAKAVYYEARGESADGQAAVAQVVINRTHRPNYPANVCGVVFQGVNHGGCQFSFACNGAMNGPLEPAAWSRARRVAADALHGHVMGAVGRAISFHVASLGAQDVGEVARIGSHVFFGPGGGHGHAYRSVRVPRLAGRTPQAPSPVIAATIAAAAHDAADAVPVVVASNSQVAAAPAAQ